MRAAEQVSGTNSAPTASRVGAAIRRGPVELGRHVVVAPGQAAPDDWNGCARVEIASEAAADAAMAGDLVDRLRNAAESLVIAGGGRTRDRLAGSR